MQPYSRSPASKCEDELQASASESPPCVWLNMRSAGLSVAVGSRTESL